MNTRQRAVLLAAAGICVVMLLFPPFRIVTKDVLPYSNAGYSFILAPPNEYATVDVATLLTQWVGVAVATVALVMGFKDRKSSGD